MYRPVNASRRARFPGSPGGGTNHASSSGIEEPVGLGPRFAEEYQSISCHGKGKFGADDDCCLFVQEPAGETNKSE